MNYTKEELEPFRFPVGRFTVPESISKEDRDIWIENIRNLPQKMRNAVQTMTEEQLDTPYRPEGWTVRQLVRHVADSHLNSYVRYKWTLTEDKPTIKTYDQNAWSSLPDALEGPIDLSLDLLETTHKSWVWVLEHMKEDEWKKEFVHPEWNKQFNLEVNLALYSWHCDHHLAHITSLIKRMNW